MRNLKVVFFTFLLALGASIVSASPSLVAGSSVDCDGDGKADLTCTGTVCYSGNPGTQGNRYGYCECRNSENEVTVHKNCKKDRPELTPQPISFFGFDVPSWQLTVTPVTGDENGIENALENEPSEPQKPSGDVV